MSARYISALVFGTALLASPFAFADTSSISVKSLSPTGALPVGSTVTFTIVPTGFTSLIYVLSDAFGTSTVSNSNFDRFGVFTWTPSVSDIGTHPLTITASDNVGNAASTTATIVVLPPPSVSIQSLSPGTTVSPGATLTFTATTSGFTNPIFTVGDSFSGTAGTSITEKNIDAAGSFSWTPDSGQQGEHLLTLYARDSLGHSASASKTLRVGSDPKLTIPSVSPSGNIAAGQTVTFTATAAGYWPTTFSIYDAFSGTKSSVTNSNINASGVFSWTPLASDFGTHVLKVIGTVGSYGQTASTTQTIVVLGPNGEVPGSETVSASSSASSTSAATTTSSTASSTVLSSLLEQLAKVQAQMATLPSPSTTPSPAPSSSNVFTVNLRQGQTSDAVLKLQNVLAAQGFLKATPNGHFGPATAAAVKKFQKANGVSPLGIVGPATRAALNALPQSSSAAASADTSASDGYVFKNFIGMRYTGTDVVELQKRLAELGFFSGSATGYFGPITEAAVKKFQTAKGIKAAGYVGPSTRAALNQ